MNKFFSITKIAIFISLVAGVFATGFLVVPISIHADSPVCDTSYNSPIFNPYPVTYSTQAGCINGVNSDFAVISGGVHGSGAWSSNLTTKVGDNVTVMIYVHNGAASNSGAVMNGAAYNTVETDSADGTTHTFTTTLSASNAASKQGTFVINTPANSTFEITAGSFNGTIGDMQPCFEYAQIFYVRMNVVAAATPPANTPPTIVLNGANPFTITQGTAFVDPGATATDKEDGNLTSKIVTTNDINNAVVGSYHVVYSVTDSGGLTSTVTRTVVVASNGGGGGGSSVCSTNYDSPIFDPYPVTWGTQAGCIGGVNTDFPVISAGIHNSGTWSPNLDAKIGDVLTVRIYVHNGAASNSGAVMHGVAYNAVETDSADGTTHTFNATLSASNAASKQGTLVIDTPANSTLQITSGSLSGTIGDMLPCFEYAQIFYITITVVPITITPAPTADISITKGESESMARVGDNVIYTLSLSNFGPNDATGVSVTDALPVGLTFVSANPTSGSYNHTTGLWTIGNMANSTSATLTISATVNAGTEGTTIINTAVASSTVTDSNISNNTSSVSLNVSNGNTGGSSSDIAVTKTSDKTTANVGDTVTYNVGVINNGPNDNTGVLITDVLPSELTLVSATSTIGNFSTTTGDWTIGGLANGASGTLTISATVNAGTEGTTITNTATASSAVSDPNPGNNTANTSTSVNNPGCTSNCGGGPSSDISITKTENKTTANTGDTVVYNINASNAGPSDATGVSVTDTLPSGLTFVSALTTIGSYSTTTGVWSIGNLSNGASTTLTISATVNSGTEGTTITNTAVGSSTITDPNPVNNTSSTTLAVNNAVCTSNCGGGPSSDIAVSKTVNESTANVGDTLTYTVGVINNGPDDASGVAVTDTLPSGLTLVSASPTIGDYSTTTGVWTIGNLIDNASTTLTISATVNSGTEGTTIINTAVASSSVPDNNPVNNTASTTVSVNNPGCTSNCGGGPSSDIAVSKTVNESTANVGDTLTYSINLINNGPNDATGVVATDTLPSGLTFVSASSTVGSYSTTTGLWTIGNLSNGASTTLTISATVNAGTEGTTITNTAVGSSDQTDLTPTNNTGSVDVNVSNPGGGGCTSNCGGGGGGGGGGISTGQSHPVGEILGATTCYYLRDYLKIDWQNDPVEVLKLQSFLNVFESEHLSLTGVFDQTTFDAVSRFQTKYSQDILIPWGPKVTKGFVYILTKKKINEIYCNTMYPLTSAQQAEIDAFRASGLNAGQNVSGGVGMIPNQSKGQNLSTGTATNTPVINLATASSSNNSATVTRNAAISILSLPSKIFTNGKYLGILLILIAIIIIIITLLSSNNSNDPPANVLKDKKIIKDNNNQKPPAKENQPVIILPGALPDEEIVIENPEEEQDEILTDI